MTLIQPDLSPTLAKCLTWRMLAHHHTKFGPAWLRRLLISLVPDPNVQRMKSIVDIMQVRSQAIIEDKKIALKAGDEAVKQQVGEGKDIMSILRKIMSVPMRPYIQLNCHSKGKYEHF